MTSRSILLAKSLLHGIKRQQSYAAINTAIIGRRLLSDSTPLENPSEELKTNLVTPAKKRGRPPQSPEERKKKIVTPPKKRGRPFKIVTDPDAPPPRRRARAASKPEQDQTGEETPKKKERPKRSGDTKPKRPKASSLDPFDGLSSPMELQPSKVWPSYYPYRREWLSRVMISNPDTARQYAEALVPENSEQKIIIEANPGAGLLSRALLSLPKTRIKKLILLEDASVTFMSTLKPLEAVDPRVVVVQAPAASWSTYLDMEANGVLDGVDTIPWEEENKQLQFVMSVPSCVHGDQLVSQLLRAIPERQWLFKYGRVRMDLLMTTRMWERLSAPVHSQSRCKVSAIAEAVCDFSEPIPSCFLLPHFDHFYPARWGQSTCQMATCKIVPKAHQLIAPGDLEMWDYCLRKIFVLRATPISASLFTLGAGGVNLLEKLTNPSLPENQRIDPNKTTRDLDAHDWSLIVNAFKAWPFRPSDLSMENHLSRNYLA